MYRCTSALKPSSRADGNRHAKTRSHETQRFLVIVIMLAGLVIVSGCNGRAQPPGAIIGTATLEVDFPEGHALADKSFEVDCRERSTVFSLMKSAQAAGKLGFEYRAGITDAAESIFVDSIEGVEIGGGQFWTYYVNDELADQGCGTMPIRPNDRLRWVYGRAPKELGGD